MTEDEKKAAVEELKKQLAAPDMPATRRYRVFGDRDDNNRVSVMEIGQPGAYTRDPDRIPPVTMVDGQLKIGDSPLVTRALERIRNRKVDDRRPPVPADVVLVRSSRIATFEQTGRLPLDESSEVVPRVEWEKNLTIRGLFSIRDWQTRWNAVKLGLRKLWLKATFRWT